MSVATAFAPVRRLSDWLGDIVPAKSRFDLFGLSAGLRAHRIYTALEKKSDADLAKLGLTRQDLPRVAMNAAFGHRDA